jgi:hypothetical protein
VQPVGADDDIGIDLAPPPTFQRGDTDRASAAVNLHAVHADAVSDIDSALESGVHEHTIEQCSPRRV